ncbi:hypothetical protein UlMin_028105 [Ulmus minor]
MLKKMRDDPLSQLEQVDMLQRLGLSYHFEKEIESIMKAISTNHTWNKTNLHAAALEFRLLRQHRYHLEPQDVFNIFKDDTGNFKACLGDDVMGLLSLYEASFHLKQGEIILEEARDFTTKHLQRFMNNTKDDQDYQFLLVSHALELQLHWRVPRIEARWFIDVYEIKRDMNPTLLELAKLDFNVVQQKHQEELKHLARWWKDTGLVQKLNYSRDRMVECFIWTMGCAFEPDFEYCRIMITKLSSFLTVVDDTYDVYGTLDELELFTDIAKRWDVNAVDQIQNYMKILFLSLYNFTNELALDVLKEQDLHIFKYLNKIFADCFRCYILEVRWYHSGHVPTFQEYIENGLITLGIPLLASVAYCCLSKQSIKEEVLEFVVQYPNIMRQAALISRLANDLSTSSFELQRGHPPSSIQCYMHENGVSEDEARQYIKNFINEIWKKMNEERDAASLLTNRFIDMLMDVARISMWMYEKGDGFGFQNQCNTKEGILSLFINPIHMGYKNQED